MKRIPRMLTALLLAVIMLITSVTPALAAATGKLTTYNTSHYFQSYANDKWSDLKTPKHTLNSNKSLVFYCLQHKKSTPKGQVYNLENVMESYNEKTRNGIYAIMFNGYPFNSYGLSAEKAFYATANALRCWLAERGDSQHYNMSKLNDFNATKLRSLAATGTITKKLKVKDTANIAMLQFMVELLISARNQETMAHNIYLDAMDVQLVNSGNYFTGTSQVTIENLRGGYKILSIYGRFFKLYTYAALAPVPLSTFAGEGTSSVGVHFLKSFAGVCLEGAVVVIACLIYSAFVSSSPVQLRENMTAVNMVWCYVGETIFGMLVLVGSIKASDRVIKELMGL